jgi:hypothetical protein
MEEIGGFRDREQLWLQHSTFEGVNHEGSVAMLPVLAEHTGLEPLCHYKYCLTPRLNETNETLLKASQKFYG